MAVVDAGYVIGLWDWALRQPHERELRSFIREIRTMYDIKRKVVIPKEYRKVAQEVRTGQTLLRDICGRVTASLTKEPPIYQVQPRDDTDDTKRAASIAGRWLSGTIEDMTRMSPEDVIFKSAGALVLDSESVIKTVHRPEAWANFPMREKDEDPKKYTARADKYARGGVANPFAERQVDRLQMAFGDGEYGDEWAIEYGEYATPYHAAGAILNPDRPTPELMLAGPPTAGSESPNTAGGGLASKTIKLEYCDMTTWAVVINGRMAPGFPRDNPYPGMLPWHRATAPPAMYPLKFLAPALDSLETMQLNWAYLTAFPVVVIEALAGVQQMLEGLPVGNTGAPPDNTKVWHPGEGWFPPPGYSLKFLEPPAAGAELHQIKADIREMIDVVGVPSVFRGQGGSRQAGYSINQLMAASQMTYKKLVEGLERQQEKVARFLFGCVGSTTKQTIYILGNDGDAKRWLGMKPTGTVQQYVAPVDQLGPSDCHFRPVLPTDEEKMLMLATQALNAPRRTLSHETMLMRLLQVDDPQGEMDKIWAEEALESEMVSTAVLIEAMRMAELPVPGAAPVLPPPGPPPAINDAVNQGEPTIPALTQPLTPNTNIPTIGPGRGGRPAGSFPGVR